MADVMERLLAAMNRHDARAMAACFAADYRSEQPVHPNRGFGGSEQVEANWTSLFASAPDLVVRWVASCSAGDVVWTEWDMTGTYRDGSPFVMRGVTVVGIRDDKIAWQRLYLEQVEEGGADIEATVRHLSRPPSAKD